MATDPNTIRSYNQNAEGYNKHVSDPTDSIFHSYYEKPAIRAALPSLDNLEVISIGCGSGVDTRWLVDNGAKKVVGIDISEGLIDIAKRNHPDIEFHQMDMEQLDFEDASFDLAYSSLAIHYIDDWTQTLTETHRILREGGQYVFSCGHPIDSSLEFEVDGNVKYAILGRKVNLDTKKRIFYGDYLAVEDKGVKPLSWMIGDIEVTTYHRTVSKMIEQISAAGFKIERLIEPEPTIEMQEAAPIMYEQLRRIPAFMIWVLKKQ